MTTSRHFFIAGAFLPIVVPVLAGLLALAGGLPIASLGGSANSVVEVAMFIAFSGIVSVIPYGAFIVFAIRRRRAGASWMSLVWDGPAYVAVSATLIFAIILWIQSGFGTSLLISTFFASVAAVIGYGYAALIAGLYLAGRRAGWIEPGDEA